MSGIDWTMANLTYLKGQCHIFALALNRRYNWSIAVLRDQDDDPVHVVCLRAGNADEPVDIRGLNDLESLREGIENADDTWFDFSVTLEDINKWMESGTLNKATEADIVEAVRLIDAILAEDPDYFGASNVVYDTEAANESIEVDTASGKCTVFYNNIAREPEEDPYLQRLGWYYQSLAFDEPPSGPYDNRDDAIAGAIEQFGDTSTKHQAR